MVKGKNVNLFLIDGETRGLIKSTLANWTGVTYKIPRTNLEKAKGIKDLNQTGVYLLFGTLNDTEEPTVYVGQAGGRKNGLGILKRLDEQSRELNKRYWWTEAVAFTTSDKFGSTEIDYLENRFYNMARKANRFEVVNDNEPHLGNVTEEKESELEEFTTYAKIVIGALGYKVFEPVTRPKSHENEDSQVLDNEPELYYVKGEVKATGKRTESGFVVFAGSKIAEKVNKSCPKSAKNNRDTYKTKIFDGKLEEDTLFTSPSAAAAFVGATSLNGNVEWKNKDGKTLKEIENNKKPL